MSAGEVALRTQDSWLALASHLLQTLLLFLQKEGGSSCPGSAPLPLSGPHSPGLRQGAVALADLAASWGGKGASSVLSASDLTEVINLVKEGCTPSVEYVTKLGAVAQGQTADLGPGGNPGPSQHQGA